MAPNSPACIVNDFPNNTANVSVALRKVKSTELGGGGSVGSVCLEDTTALALSANNSTHPEIDESCQSEHTGIVKHVIRGK